MIRLEDQWARIPFGEQTKLISVAHTKFPNGGSWSYFVPQDAAEVPKGFGWSTTRRAAGSASKSSACVYRAAYGFGRTDTPP
jgi:hypothetical protein